MMVRSGAGGGVTLRPEAPRPRGALFAEAGAGAGGEEVR